MNLILFFVCVNLVKSLRIIQHRNSKDGVHLIKVGNEKASKAHIFFINMKEATDRRQCVHSQLLDAPFPVTRIEAATRSSQYDRCQEIFSNKKLSQYSTSSRRRRPDSSGVGPGQSALYCSNYLTWKYFYYNSTAEYALIMEDDVIMNEGFWDRVQSLLDSKCDHDWEYLTVDGRATGQAKKQFKNLGQEGQCLHARSGREEHIGHMTVRCTHFQIIRRSAISHLLNHAQTHGPQILDWWAVAFPTDTIKMNQWSPGICGQSSYQGLNAVGCQHFSSSISK